LIQILRGRADIYNISLHIFTKKVKRGQISATVVRGEPPTINLQYLRLLTAGIRRLHPAICYNGRLLKLLQQHLTTVQTINTLHLHRKLANASLTCSVQMTVQINLSITMIHYTNNDASNLKVGKGEVVPVFN